jgi:uncharacterized cupredoxin-like copper-binding protein
MQHPKRLVALLASGALLAVPIVGCGDDNSSGGDSSSTAASTTESTTSGGGGAGGTVALSETEYKIDPSDPTTKAGEVTFSVTNDGSITHALEVEGPGEEQKTDDIAPGQSAQVTVDLSKPGKYEFYCPIDSHRDQGMEGEITVQ